MANYLHKNEKFHIFSKSPVSSDIEVSQAVNKSGHTVSISDVWADSIPWFTEVSDKSIGAARAKAASYNDLLLIGNTIYKRRGVQNSDGTFSETTADKYEESFFNDLWEEDKDFTAAWNYALTGIANVVTPQSIEPKTITIYNKENLPVVNYHVGKTIDLLTTDNNSGFGSTMAARMFIDGKVVSQFIQPSDKIEDGKPSSKYGVIVYTSENVNTKYSFISEGESDSDFVNNAYAGVIQFNEEHNKNHKFAASVFEYIGSTMDKKLSLDSSELKSHVSDTDIHVTKSQKKDWDDHVKSSDMHVTVADRTNWDSKINEVLPGDYISVSDKTTVSVKTASTINDNSTTVPTTQAVYNHITNTNSNYVHLTEKQKIGLYETVEQISSQRGKTTDDDRPIIGCIALVPSEFVPTPQENVKLSSLYISRMFGPSTTYYEPNHIVYSKKMCIWELNDSDNTIKYKTSINTNIQGKDEDFYLIDVNLTKYVTLELGKTYFITFHGSDYKPNQVAATSQKYGFNAPAYDLYTCKSTGGGGIYYVIPGANETFSYNNIDKTRTLKCILNSAREIEHVVTDKNFDDYVKESFINNSDELIGFTAEHLINEKIGEHAADKTIHITSEEKSLIQGSEKDIVCFADISSSTTTSAAVGGIVLEPSETFIANKIVISDLSFGANDTPNSLYIWRNDESTAMYQESESVPPTKVGNMYTWNLSENIAFVKGNTYYFTWHAKKNLNASHERGYTPTIKKYSYVSGDIYPLKTTQYFSSTDIDRNNTVKCKFYYNATQEQLNKSNFNFGSLQNTDRAVCYGFIAECPNTGFVNQLTLSVSTASQPTNDNPVMTSPETYIIVHEEGNGIKTEVARSNESKSVTNSAINKDTFSEMTYTFDAFEMKKGKKYFCEFVSIEDETVNSNRINLKLALREGKTGVIGNVGRDNWSIIHTNFMGCFVFSNNSSTEELFAGTPLQFKLSVREGLTLFNPIISCSSNISTSSIMDIENSAIVKLETNDDTYTGNHYIYVIAPFFDSTTNMSGQINKVYPISIFE